MNTAKEIIMRLVNDIPETKAGEVIDFLTYLKNKEEQELVLDSREEQELWDIIENDERVSSEEVSKLIEGE